MPKALENALKKEARKLYKAGKLRGKGSEKQKEGHFVYGYMNNHGYMKGNKRVK